MILASGVVVNTGYDERTVVRRPVLYFFPPRVSLRLPTGSVLVAVYSCPAVKTGFFVRSPVIFIPCRIPSSTLNDAIGWRPLVFRRDLRRCKIHGIIIYIKKNNNNNKHWPSYLPNIKLVTHVYACVCVCLYYVYIA